MLLGISRVVAEKDIQLGRFYLQHSYRGEPRLFLCVAGPDDDENSKRAIIIDPASEHPILLQDIPNMGPAVELPDIHVRVDAPSLDGTEHTTSVRAPMLFVVDQTPYLAALTGWRGYVAVDIASGSILKQPPSSWASFSRWQLVMDENGEEIPIASFGFDE